VIWLNPLLGSPGYEPVTQGMSVALPYVDVFASAHNLSGLQALERYLHSPRGRSGRRRRPIEASSGTLVTAGRAAAAVARHPGDGL